MKSTNTKIKLLIIIFILSMTGFASAQNDSITPVKRSHVNNIFKLNVPALLLGSISIQDEVYFNSKFSVALGINLGVSSLFLPKAFFGGDKVAMKDMTFSGYSITPEGRYYLRKKAPNGIYLAPYVRISNYDLNQIKINYVSTVDTVEVEKTAIMEGTYKQQSFGILFGNQWRSGTHFVFDWWIAGVAFGGVKLDMNAKGEFTDDDQESIENTIKDFSENVTSVHYSINSTNVIINYKQPYSIRMGFCIGYLF
jgi:hypothetical protein